MVLIFSPGRYYFMKPVELVKVFKIWQILPCLDAPIIHYPKGCLEVYKMTFIFKESTFINTGDIGLNMPWILEFSKVNSQIRLVMTLLLK